MCNNPNLDLVNINAYPKFGQIPSIHSKDIEPIISTKTVLIFTIATLLPKREVNETLIKMYIQMGMPDHSIGPEM